jgi:NADPH-dependent curcumin reductase CurA
MEGGPTDSAPLVNRRVVLAARADGRPVTLENFRIEDCPVPELAEGELLVRNRFLSIDPYMRGRMDGARSYAKPVEIGEVMVGGTVGIVVASRNERFAIGDLVQGRLGWQRYAVSDGNGLSRLPELPGVPLSAYLGVLGMPGVTAWYGLNRILEPAAGQTLVVSAASGAVGSVVGQLAKAAGCRVVGIAGGAEKCAIATELYGFDVCIDYKRGHVAADLIAAAPQGIDMLFENVGGALMDAAFAHMNPFGRVAVCGLISGYDGGGTPLNQVRSILVNRLRVQGFIISDHPDVWPEALRDLSARVTAGTLKWRETIAEGIDAAPQALIDLLAGRNVGKQLVRLDPAH